MSAMHDELLVGVLAGLLAAGFLAWLLLRFRASRFERRRRKSHSRIVSTARRPTVKFSVRPPKDR